MMIFNSFNAANDYNFGAQDRTAVASRVLLPANKTLGGICLALAGKFFQKEL